MEVFDRALALERLGGDEERLSRLLTGFQKKMPSVMKSLDKALQKKKASLLERAAEELRQSTREIGAEGMEALAAQMRDAARSGDFETVETLIGHMGMELDWLLRILDENRCSGNL